MKLLLVTLPRTRSGMRDTQLFRRSFQALCQAQGHEAPTLHVVVVLHVKSPLQYSPWSHKVLKP